MARLLRRAVLGRGGLPAPRRRGTFVELSAPTIGYDQLSVMLDLVERPYRVHRLPARPAHFEGGAVEVMLIAHASGIVRSIIWRKLGH